MPSCGACGQSDGTGPGIALTSALARTASERREAIGTLERRATGLATAVAAEEVALRRRVAGAIADGLRGVERGC